MGDGSFPTSPALRFLFRYRDLVADTLPEHRAVLQGAGMVLVGMVEATQ